VERLGVLTYGLLKWQRHRWNDLPPMLPWWRLAPQFVLSAGCFGVVLRRFVVGDDPDWLAW